MRIKENVTIIPAKTAERKTFLKVAAYCRVSSDSNKSPMKKPQLLV